MPGPLPTRAVTAVSAAMLLTLLLPLAPAVGASAQDDPTACWAAPEDNGSYALPQTVPGSLTSMSPRPGPEILYRDAPRAPQLENTGSWTAAPILISGTSAYRDGEFLYQDFLYDETGTYPDEPARYGGNAADLVELRLELRGDALAARITFNTLLEPSAVATTIALGGSEPVPMPHGAGASMPGEVFITVHGCQADVVAADGTIGARLDAVVDLERRQVDVEVPVDVFDPRHQETFRVSAATGLWDADAGAYLRPDPDAPALMNVAFRYGEPFEGFRHARQDAALASGDLSGFFAEVDVATLTAGVDDTMADQPGGVPRSGPMSRIYASHFETQQGRGSYVPALTTPLYPGYEPCHDPCSPQFAGRLQPYGIVVPDVPPPARWGISLFHHGCNEDYNTFLDRAARFAQLDAPSLAVTNQARGVCIWEFEQAGADLYEVWADVARHYPLDPDGATLSGQSLGGYATFKNAVQFPDLFAAVNPHIGPPAASGAFAGRPAPPQAGEGTLLHDLLPSLRHVPVVYWVAQQDELVPYTGVQQVADILAALEYRHTFRAFAGDHAFVGHFLQNYDPQGDYLAHRRVQRDPARVTYVFSGFMHQPEYGLTSDHAYWLSGLDLSDDSGDAPLGTIDAVSHGFGVADAPPGPLERTAGFYPTSVNGTPVPYVGQDLEWSEAPDEPAADVLDITATNLSSVTVDVDRARLSCTPTVNVTSDVPLDVRLVGRACDDGVGVVRHGGPERTATAAAVSRATHPSAEVVLLARAEDPADALAGGPLAAGRDAPLLLTDGQRLSPAARAEIQRLGARRAVVLGGPAAVSAAVEAELRAMGLAIERVQGGTRFGTAAAVAAALSATPRRVFLADGQHGDPARGWPDALAVSPLAAFVREPILLVTADRLPEETADALDALDPDEVVVVGGEAAVGPQVVAAVEARGHHVRRVGGRTRYATATLLWREAVDAGMAMGDLWVATGRSFPDALVAGPAVARAGGSFLIVDGTDLDSSHEVTDVLESLAGAVDRLAVLGGEAAISSHVEGQILGRLAGAA